MEETRRLTLAGALSGLAFASMFLEFPMFPQAAFLKYDPSEVVAFIAVLGFGLKTGILVIVVKDILFYLVKSGDPVGIAMNALAGIVFVMMVHLTWGEETSKKILGGILSTSVVTGVMVVANALVVPLYFRAPFDLFLKFLPFIVAFNLIKFGADYYIGGLIFERLGPVLKT